MKASEKSFSKTAEFHGHTCPGLAFGYRASVLGLEELGIDRSGDEELVCIVENDACGIDAIQYITGCTVGKGNLILHDYGKHVYTFISRKSGDAVRVVLKSQDNAGHRSSRADELRAKVFAGNALPEEEKEFWDLMGQRVEELLHAPAEELFDVQHVKVKMPTRARIFKSVPCAVCGEMVAESRARVQDGKIVCIPCFKEYSRGW